MNGVTMPDSSATQSKTEEELCLGKDFFQRVYDHAAIAMVICDLDGNYLSVNNAMCQLVGYSSAELLSMRYSEIVHPHDTGDAGLWRQQITDDKPNTLQYEKRYIHKSGKILWTLAIVSVVKSDSGEPLYSIGQLIDLDGDKQLAQQQRWTYNQRDNLVREVHHRIKNNLQSVTGLLRRQIRANPAAGDTLRQAIGQVEAIAVVHGLQSSADNQHIRICDMLCGIIQEANKLQPDQHRIACPPRPSVPALIHSVEAVPIALILNELITNAIKHHCPLHDFNIPITITRLDHACVQITIRNPAAQLSPDFDFDAIKGMGMGLKLVRALLPNDGMHIDFTHNAGQLTVTATLQPPIIYSTAAPHPIY